MPARLNRFLQAAFEGMNDSSDPQTGTPRTAKLLQNVYPVDAEKGGGTTGRPGFVLSSATQLGVTGHNVCQRFYQFTKTDGTEYTLGFAGAQMYKFSWNGTVVTAVSVVTLAASVGLSSDLAIFCSTYNNTLVVQPNDGTNKPWTWDGTTFTSLTQAPLAYGGPTVYDGHLMFIVWGTRNQIQWSEVNAANTGYNNSPYTDYWSLTQTDNTALYAIRGTNEALYYWRARSMGRILGGVTATWSTDGTHDGVSLKTGTQSPAAICDYNTDIFFLDADGRPHVLQSGGVVSPFWTDYRNTLLNIPRSGLATAWAAAFLPIPLILLAVAETGQTYNNLILTIKPSPDPAAAGLWRGWTVCAMDMVKNGNGVPTLMVGGSDGYAYVVGDPNTGTDWDDALQAGTTAVQHVVQPSYLGFDPRMNRQFDVVRVQLKALTPLTNVVLDYQTPALTETLTAQSTTGGLSLWDQFQWDSGQWSNPGSSVPLVWGINGYGHWCLPRITHQTLTERFGLNVVQVDAFDAGVDPLEV